MAAPAIAQAAEAPAFLGVAASLTGRRWTGPPPELDRAAQALAQATGLPPAVALLLARAGVAAPDVPAYLAPTLRELMPDPSTLRDMDRAVAVMQAHLAAGHRIAVFADYDVDGAASAALLRGWLGALGVRPTVYVPDRVAEGYGPNVPAMERLAADHALIVCVDCGTAAHQAVAAAQAKGAEVIVLDHHQGGETLPPARAVVNPNRQDEDTPLSVLCAAGVVFLFLVALNRARRQAGQLAPDLMAHLDLVALATVADVASLTGLNRAFVRQGLTVMARRGRPGLTALADIAELSGPPEAYHLGYRLGPRINAGGRVGQADLGARLLSAPDAAAALPMARALDALNRERQTIEAEVLEAARAQAEARGADGPLVWAAGEGWHPGVVGIVAARLKEAFDRPALVIGLHGDVGTGSGRSIPGVDLGAAIARLAHEGHIPKGGGHAMAAGLTVDAARLGPAMARLGALLARQGAGAAPVATLRVDGLLGPRAATVEFLESLADAGPFGAGAPAPRFAFEAVRIAHARTVGNGHLSLRLEDATGRLDAIAFGAADGPLAALAQGGGLAWHVAGRLELDRWQGRLRPKLKLEDAAPAGQNRA